MPSLDKTLPVAFNLDVITRVGARSIHSFITRRHTISKDRYGIEAKTDFTSISTATSVGRYRDATVVTLS